MSHFAVHSDIKSALPWRDYRHRPAVTVSSPLCFTHKTSDMKRSCRVMQSCSGTEVALSSSPEESLSSEQRRRQSCCHRGRFSMTTPCRVLYKCCVVIPISIIIIISDREIIIANIFITIIIMVKNNFKLSLIFPSLQCNQTQIKVSVGKGDYLKKKCNWKSKERGEKNKNLSGGELWRGGRKLGKKRRDRELERHKE